MTKPTINEITEYFFERTQDLVLSKNEAETFYNRYMSNGWMVGKTPMKAWKFAVLNWLKNIKRFEPDAKLDEQSEYYNKQRALGLTWTRVPNSNIFKWQKV